MFSDPTVQHMFPLLFGVLPSTEKAIGVLDRVSLATPKVNRSSSAIRTHNTLSLPLK